MYFVDLNHVGCVAKYRVVIEFLRTYFCRHCALCKIKKIKLFQN